jgi:hypothetical protein
VLFWRLLRHPQQGTAPRFMTKSHITKHSRYALWSLRWVHDGARHADRLQALPRDAELLAFEAGCEDYREREVDEVEWQGGRVYLHLGARRDDPREAKRCGRCLRSLEAGGPHRPRSDSGGRSAPARSRARQPARAQWRAARPGVTGHHPEAAGGSLGVVGRSWHDSVQTVRMAARIGGPRGSGSRR